MESSILEQIITWTIDTISSLGYPGVFLLMALQAVLIPIPQEIIMPFSGFLVAEGRFNLFTLSLVGALGSLAGSWVTYALGYWGHKTLTKKLVDKYGKYIFLTEEEVESSIKLFLKHGFWVVPFSKIFPGIRSVISLPAGMAKFSFWEFSVLTFIGSFVWAFVLAYVGVKLGENWTILTRYIRTFELAIILIVAALVALYIFRKFKKSKK